MKGTNIIKESIVTFSDPDGSDMKGDVVSPSPEQALKLLKEMIETNKSKTKKPKHKVKWGFNSSPHEQFKKTLDDTFMSFVVWAKMKNNENDKETCSYNVSKAFRRLEAYATWMHENEQDLTNPPLNPTSPVFKAASDAFQMRVSVEKNGDFVWWFDIGVIDEKAIKNMKPEDSLRFFVWYCHYIMYDEVAQRNGMTIVENCAKMGFFKMFGLLPMKLSAKLDRLCIGVLPIKCNKLYILEMSGWIKTFMKFMGMFMSKKMLSRFVEIEDWEEIPKLLGEDCIPKNFGKLEGKLENDPILKQYFSS